VRWNVDRFPVREATEGDAGTGAGGEHEFDTAERGRPRRPGRARHYRQTVRSAPGGT